MANHTDAVEAEKGGAAGFGVVNTLLKFVESAFGQIRA